MPNESIIRKKAKWILWCKIAQPFQTPHECWVQWHSAEPGPFLFKWLPSRVPGGFYAWLSPAPWIGSPIQGPWLECWSGSADDSPSLGSVMKLFMCAAYSAHRALHSGLLYVWMCVFLSLWWHVLVINPLVCTTQNDCRLINDHQLQALLEIQWFWCMLLWEEYICYYRNSCSQCSLVRLWEP